MVSRAQYERRKDAHIAEVVERQKRVRQENARFIREYKGSRPCLDCGNSFPYYVMDFDHVRGEKRFELSDAKHKSLPLIIAEIAKCDLICSNCHRIRTFTKKQHLSTQTPSAGDGDVSQQLSLFC